MYHAWRKRYCACPRWRCVSHPIWSHPSHVRKALAHCGCTTYASFLVFIVPISKQSTMLSTKAYTMWNTRWCMDMQMLYLPHKVLLWTMGRNLMSKWMGNLGSWSVTLKWICIVWALPLCFFNNSDITKSKSTPPPFAADKMTPSSSLQEIHQSISLPVQAIQGWTWMEQLAPTYNCHC